MKLSRLSFLVSLAALVGCGESHNAPQDAQIVFDAFFPDAGTDAGPPPNPVGPRCTTDEECTGGTYCEGVLGGYCTAICSTDEECPGDSVCVQLTQTTSYCLASCDPSASTDQCPPGNGCTPGSPGFPPACFPGCEADSDCPAGLTCALGGGGFEAGICLDDDQPLGGGCRSDGDCPPSSRCASEADFDFPGGACIIIGCDDVGNTGCPNDAQCLPSGFGGGICWDGCSTDADCRPEYECVAPSSDPSRTICQPRFVPSNLGTVCSPTGSCAGGECLTENFSGFPSSYCALPGCNPIANTGCPDNGECVAASDGSGLCLFGCTADTDCRAGYRCDPIRRDQPDGPRACFPGCTEDAQCTGRRRDGTRNVCNPGTGLCNRPFNSASLGTACSGGFGECGGGRCITADQGWPGGMCTYPGCRLSGEGPSATCPTGGVCTDDGTGDPEIGVCVPTCTVGGSTCRSGYTCVALTEGGTEGACRPAP
jgi:hypothetical protein